MKLFKVCLVASIVALMLSGGQALATEIDLVAGQHTNVGSVNVYCSDGVLTINFGLMAGYCFVETHQYVDGVEPKKHAPGQFTYKHEDLSMDGECTNFDQYVADGFGQTYLASHAVVCENLGLGPDYDGYVSLIEEAKDENGVVTIRMTDGPSAGDDSYWEVQVTGGDLTGVDYPGWCVDTYRTIGTGSDYDAVPVPAYIVDEFGDVVLNEAGLSGLLDYWWNMDQVTWVINQNWVGQDSGCPPDSGGNTTFTYGDVQRAIWELVEDNPTTAGLGPWSQCRVDEILADALANGVGFIPDDCNLFIPVILNPINTDGDTNRQITIAQVTFIEINTPCETILGNCETAWALGGIPFPKSWGEYYSVTCGPPLP